MMRTDGSLMAVAADTPQARGPAHAPVRPGTRPAFAFHGLIGRNPAMQQLFAAIHRFAPHARTTLITGEIGTGKGAVAQVLYRLGPRRGGAFVQVACADLPVAPVDWVDAASAADRDTTLFFDDVADLPAGEQLRLARLLTAAEGEDNGGVVHVIAATSHDVQAAIAAGRFRSDLYYRLGVFTLHLPRLRDRLDDLPDLAAAFLHDVSTRLHLPTRHLTPGAIRVLHAHAWPGNLRELHNVLERAAVLSDADTVGEGAIRAALAGGATTSVEGPATATPPSRLDDAQRAHVLAVLHNVRGNKSRAATSLGISRRALYRLLDRLGA